MQINSYKLNLSSEHEYVQQTNVNISAVQNIRTTKTFYNESEELNLSAKGIFKTDSQTISISLDAKLYREDSYTTTAIQSALKDPLVINTNGALAQVDKKSTFEFDIDVDGKQEKMSSLAAGNGFLAIDLNQNGKIDDGSELFGAKSGDGFLELSAYDGNKDGIIDERDSVFGKLKIWFKNGDKSSLVSLKSERVGAILLDAISSEFELKNGANTNAKIQKSGVVLFEDNKAGWISHVDFATQEIEQKEENSKAAEQKSINTQISLEQPKQVAKNDGDIISKTVKGLKQKLKDIEKEILTSDSEIKKEALKFERLQIIAQLTALGGSELQNT